jgi:hypothetical protein
MHSKLKKMNEMTSKYGWKKVHDWTLLSVKMNNDGQTPSMTCIKNIDHGRISFLIHELQY